MLSEVLNRDINCVCGRTHRCNIRFLSIERGALNRIAEAVQPYSHVLIVADSNTYPICGEQVKQQLGERLEQVCLFNTEGLLVPNEGSIAEIESCLTPQTDLILGIGTGVINDLGKYVSFYHGIKCGIVVTATSMDGFASSGAAMILGGMKLTLTTHAPDILIGDTDILKDAPMDMIRAGYADIIGKYSALCDWKLSHLINGEHLCPFVYDLVMRKTNDIRNMAKRIAARDPEAIGTLLETLVLIGACLTLLSTTRPGSGSEHHLSHFYEVTGLIEGKPYFLHGTDVGYATIVTAGLREEIVKVDVPKFHPFSDEKRVKCYKKIFRDYWKEVWDIQEEAGFYRQDLEGIYREKWDEVCAILRECPTADDIRDMLTDIGFDLDAFEALYGTQKIRNSIWFGKDLKNRYTVLPLYCSLFFDGEHQNEV